ncbi:MAG: hypothetical protein JXB03_03930, partial [Spirochaetales bacterium]|nr:hypothetical protein [Spirochaetales bacterium]
MVYTLYLFSYLPVVLFAFALWSELHKKQEFGERPAVLLMSITAITFAGIVSLLSFFAAGNDADTRRLLLVNSAFPLLLISIYLLEYSIHCQRIRRSFLTEDHKRAFKPALYALIILGIFSAVSSGFMIARIAGSGVDLRAYGNKAGFASSLLLFTACLYIAGRVFNFQEGLIRKKHYPFILVSVSVIIANFSSLVAGSHGSVQAAAFVGILILGTYVYRMYQEYFFYRLFHVNDLLVKQDTATKTRNKLINLSIVSTKEKDIDILSELLDAARERILHDLPLPQYKITGLALYRLNRGVFSIEHQSLVKGYCAPLMKFDAIKRSNDEQIRKFNLETKFNAEHILSAGPAQSATFAEEAVYRLLSEKQLIYIDPLPSAYRGVVKMMALYPIMNNEAVTGFFLIEKDSFDKLFPHETAQLSDTSESINTLFSLMYGKEVQEERNRLEGEMNIAKEIQTSIVPKELDIPGYETACSMSTATEVGGDAYDSRQNPFGNYFSIGDVSGHGLPSGITALIQITAFQTALETSQVLAKELRISQMYDIINRILCTINRDRIGSDKFMTGNV